MNQGQTMKTSLVKRMKTKDKINIQIFFKDGEFPINNLIIKIFKLNFSLLFFDLTPVWNYNYKNKN